MAATGACAWPRYTRPERLRAIDDPLSRETFWYPVAIATDMIGTVATVTKLLIKFI
jgi:hypothetical protein